MPNQTVREKTLANAISLVESGSPVGYMDQSTLVWEIFRLRQELDITKEVLNNTTRSVEEIFGFDWAPAKYEVESHGNQGWTMIVGKAVRKMREEIENLRDDLDHDDPIVQDH